jgi:hypothetical protein
MEFTVSLYNTISMILYTLSAHSDYKFTQSNFMNCKEILRMPITVSIIKIVFNVKHASSEKNTSTRSRKTLAIDS